MHDESSSRDRKRILLLVISPMIAVSVIVLTLTLWMVYPSNLEQRELDLGLVAKSDMREVMTPFLKAAASAFGIAAVVVFIGSLLALRMARPVVRRIEDSQHRFRTLVEAAPDPMVIIDASGEIVMINRRAEELFGYSRDEITALQQNSRGDAAFRGIPAVTSLRVYLTPSSSQSQFLRRNLLCNTSLVYYTGSRGPAGIEGRPE